MAFCLLAGAPAFPQPPPALEIEAPPELASARARLESYDLGPLAEIVRLIGLDAPGPPMRVVLAAAGSEWAGQVAPWTAGFAIGDAGLIVLFPDRSPSYPHDTLEDVLRHEVAHVLISRAAGGQPVPRWFHEGLAMAVERTWGLRDRSRLATELVFGPHAALPDIDALLTGNQGMQSRGYSLAAAVVRDLVAEYGEGAPGEILRQVKGGQPFDVALASVTRRPVVVFEAEFWDRQRTWTTWVPVIASSTTLWLGVIGLAALAVRRRRRRAAAIRRRWAEEEAAEQAAEAAAAAKAAFEDTDPRDNGGLVH
jgi:MYXO-CTERM domain-containing protein